MQIRDCHECGKRFDKSTTRRTKYCSDVCANTAKLRHIKEHQARNKSEIQSEKREYYLKNRERFIEYSKRYSAKNAEAKKQYRKEYYMKNKDKWKK